MRGQCTRFSRWTIRSAAVVAALGLVSPVLAASSWFGNTSTDPDWFVAGYWSPSGIPGTGTNVNINAGTSSTNPIIINTTEAGAGSTGLATASALDLGGTLSTNAGYLHKLSGFTPLGG